MTRLITFEIDTLYLTVYEDALGELHYSQGNYSNLRYPIQRLNFSSISQFKSWMKVGNKQHIVVTDKYVDAAGNLRSVAPNEKKL